MAKIVPAILESDYDAFLRKIDAISRIPEVQRIQVDFADGKFTPRPTISLADMQVLNPVFLWEAHLMVENPQEHFLDAKILGFNTVIFHYEAVGDKSKLKHLADEVRSLKMQPGLAINPETTVEEVLPDVENFEQILVMGVHPGAQGGEFLPETFEKVKKLKKALKIPIIEVDGGASLSNVKELAEAGAELIVTGSALFSEPHSPTENYLELSVAAQIIEAG